MAAVAASVLNALKASGQDKEKEEFVQTDWAYAPLKDGNKHVIQEESEEFIILDSKNYPGSKFAVYLYMDGTNERQAFIPISQAKANTKAVSTKVQFMLRTKDGGEPTVVGFWA